MFTVRFSTGRLTRLAAVVLPGLAALTPSPPAFAQSLMPDDLTLAVSHGSRHGVKKLELDAGWARAQPLWQGQQWRLGLRQEAVLGEWRVPQARNITELGYSPVLRLERPSGGVTFFAEASIGVRLLSHVRLAPDTTMSSSFQFADMVGTGVQFGNGPGAQTVGLRLQHQSNAGIKHPNPGMNFVMLYYRYAF